MKYILIRSAAMSATLLMAMLLLLTGNAEAQDKTIQVGDTMPGFFLRDIDNGTFFLREYVGAEAKHDYKAVVFSLTASYCKPCRKEIPELGRMMEKYRDKGLGIWLIALESKQKAQTLIDETGTKLPVLIDRYVMVPKQIGREGIPCTLLVDAEGTVRFINTGFNEDNAEEFIARFESAVDNVLSGGSDSDTE